MKFTTPKLILLMVSQWVAVLAHAGEPLNLSPGLRQLLVQEMREVEGGLKTLAGALATANWAAAEQAAAGIAGSYVMQKRLTDNQRRELAKLPPGFVEIDAGFHRRAGALRAAAAQGDGELARFYYYRMLEDCAACHGNYAPARFPGFNRAPAPAAHHH